MLLSLSLPLSLSVCLFYCVKLIFSWFRAFFFILLRRLLLFRFLSLGAISIGLIVSVHEIESQDSQANILYIQFRILYHCATPLLVFHTII